MVVTAVLVAILAASIGLVGVAFLLGGKRGDHQSGMDYESDEFDNVEIRARRAAQEENQDDRFDS